MTSTKHARLEGLPLTPQRGHNEGCTRTFWPTPENPDSFTQIESIHTEPIEPDYQFKIERDTDSGDILCVTGLKPSHESVTDVDGPLNTIAVGQELSHTTIIGIEGRYRNIAWTRCEVNQLKITKNSRLVVDLLHSNEHLGDRLLNQDEFKGSNHEFLTTVPVTEILESLDANDPLAQTPPNTWTRTTQPGAVQTTTDAYLPPDSPYEPIDSCVELTFKPISGEGTATIVNDFLEGGPDGTVTHRLGGIPNGWKQAFGAYHDETLIGVLVLENHQNRTYFEQHGEALITRLACHPTRPKNTSSWMIARARDWAREHGYEQLGAIAGVDANRGMIYKAAGFTLDESNTEWVVGDGWQNRDGRSAVHNGEDWYKRKWICPL